jgi:glycosyltransferase involved in cell wall biosynthesis
MQPHQLTIGFPTYMRRAAIVARLKTLLADPLAHGVKILVIDNGSTDGSYEAIQTQCASPQLTLLKNETNIGIVRNLTRLFGECRTDYLLLMSDEDELLTDHLAGLLVFLGEAQPLFVSPQAIVDGKVMRGVDFTGPIEPQDFNAASFYVSGLVYHRESTCRFIDKLEALEPLNTAGRLYPLGVLATELMLQGDTYWYGKPLAEKKERLPSLIFDKGGDDYRHLPSRWRQYVDFMKYFDAHKTGTDRSDIIQKLSIMQASLESGLYERILGAIQRESPASVPAFHAGAMHRAQSSSAMVVELEAKLENFRGMIQRRDEKIKKLEARLASKA